MRIAVVGSGISGLGAAFWLSQRHEVTLFERDSRLGGHTHTHQISTSQGPLPIDTGFIVHNERTYPNLLRLFHDLGIERRKSDMSWGVKCERTGLEYSSRGLGGFFARRRSLLSPAQWRLAVDIVRFNREAVALLEQGKAESMMLGVFIAERGYSQIFRDYYLYPTVAAIWSTAPQKVLEFPAATLIRFFANHGLLQVANHPDWWVLAGGSSVYIPKLIQPLGQRVHAGVGVESITRAQAGVRLKLTNGAEAEFDEVVIAAHAPQALNMLTDASATEREVLGAFATARNEAILHTDASLLPRRKSAWASWNYRIEWDKSKPATLTYDMNRLQNLPTPERYLVTLNSSHLIHPDKVIARMIYHHPQYTLAAIRAQERFAEVSGRNRVHFCGAYWHYGFHEDGYRSALRVAQALGVPCQIL